MVRVSNSAQPRVVLLPQAYPVSGQPFTFLGIGFSTEGINRWKVRVCLIIIRDLRLGGQQEDQPNEHLKLLPFGVTYIRNPFHSENKKLLGTSASLLVTSVLLVVTRSYWEQHLFGATNSRDRRTIPREPEPRVLRCFGELVFGPGASSTRLARGKLGHLRKVRKVK